MNESTVERSETCRDRVDQIAKKVDQIQSILDELIAPSGKMSESKDTDSIITVLECGLALLGDKVENVLDQLKHLSVRL